ncbi:uncharacterized protein [Procambarus clarkii]|uniref:uncharacterized protein n=1 Tax=Procambarus clarkii TaxID=6728 RepID=UPI003741E9E2
MPHKSRQGSDTSGSGDRHGTCARNIQSWKLGNIPTETIRPRTPALLQVSEIRLPSITLHRTGEMRSVQPETSNQRLYSQAQDKPDHNSQMSKLWRQTSCLEHNLLCTERKYADSSGQDKHTHQHHIHQHQRLEHSCTATTDTHYHRAKFPESINFKSENTQKCCRNTANAKEQKTILSESTQQIYSFTTEVQLKNIVKIRAETIINCLHMTQNASQRQTQEITCVIMDKIVQQTTVTQEIDSLRQDGAQEDKHRNMDIQTTNNSRVVNNYPTNRQDQQNFTTQETDNNSQCSLICNNTNKDVLNSRDAQVPTTQETATSNQCSPTCSNTNNKVMDHSYAQILTMPGMTTSNQCSPICSDTTCEAENIEVDPEEEFY